MEVHLAIQASLQGTRLKSKETNNSNKLNMIRIPTGGRQTSYLQGWPRSWTRHLPGTTPASDQSGIWIWVTALKSSALTTRPSCFPINFQVMQCAIDRSLMLSIPSPLPIKPSTTPFTHRVLSYSKILLWSYLPLYNGLRNGNPFGSIFFQILKKVQRL